MPSQLRDPNRLKITDDRIGTNRGKIRRLRDITDQPNRLITPLGQQPRQPQRDLPMPTRDHHTHSGDYYSTTVDRRS